jgi:hypothetical protein
MCKGKPPRAVIQNCQAGQIVNVEGSAKHGGVKYLNESGCINHIAFFPKGICQFSLSFHCNSRNYWTLSRLALGTW